jgi:hypothetical protein
MIDNNRATSPPAPSRFCAALILLLTLPALAQDVGQHDDTVLNADDFRVSYAYAAVMGSGSYKIDGRHITMLRIPFGLTQRNATDDEYGIKWLAPVSIGYDDVNGDDILDLVFDKDLVTLTVLPGFVFNIPINETWNIKPFGNLGGTRDFTLNENIYMGVLGMRSLGTWEYSSGNELRWGGAIRIVGEYQSQSSDSNGFTMFETGIDYRLDTGFDVLERKVNAGVYYVYQYFTPAWDISKKPIENSDIRDVHEVGVSLGLKKPFKIFGIPINRVRLGYKRGSGLKGWSLGTDFPF